MRVIERFWINPPPNQRLICTQVIAKVADAAPGIMAPNPYFGTFPAWEARAARVREAAARPAAGRTRKVFWRGGARPSEDANATGCAAPLEVDGHASPGLEVRMAALSLALRYPETFDVAAVFKHEKTRALHRRQLVDWLRCDAARRGFPGSEKRDAFAPGAARLLAAGRVEPSEFPAYAVLASLPGDTHGSFSQHLNHLWAAGSAVLLWRWAESRALYSEWYYAGLELCGNQPLVWGAHQTSELSISVKSKSIRLIFGRIDCSRRVLEAQQKALRRNGRIRAH